MTVAIEIALHISGDGPAEAALREHCEWLNARQHTSAYHEVIAHLAMVKARQSWLLADTYRRLEAQAEQRRARAAARREAAP